MRPIHTGYATWRVMRCSTDARQKLQKQQSKYPHRTYDTTLFALNGVGIHFLHASLMLCYGGFFCFQRQQISHFAFFPTAERHQFKFLASYIYRPYLLERLQIRSKDLILSRICITLHSAWTQDVAHCVITWCIAWRVASSVDEAWVSFQDGTVWISQNEPVQIASALLLFLFSGRSSWGKNQRYVLCRTHWWCTGKATSFSSRMVGQLPLFFRQINVPKNNHTTF